jgi:hypothetical protein
MAGGWDGVKPVAHNLEICKLVENNPANAPLIAAAPEMYEAMKILERIVTELYPGHIEPDDEHMEEYKAVWSATMNARSVLAKARGNSHAE